MQHYSLYESIASGGMGTVHYGRARRSSGLSRVVAVKRLRGDLARDPGCLAMFKDELRLATRVRHPNVVGTLDMVEQDGELLMVMELVQGESLQELIARATQAGQRVPPAIAVSVICGILQGLEAAHDATSVSGEPLSIVHRDVSPENILIGRDGIARLLDFGIARSAGRMHVTRIGEIKGKPSYLAPEQILESGRYVDRRADIYGASVVLWEALTGKRLFDGDTPVATLSRVLNEPVPRPSTIAGSLPEGLDDAVMRGLSRNRDDRYTTALEMARALRRVCGTLLPFEVADWVAATVPDSLARQAEVVTRLESAPPERDEVEPELQAAPPPAAAPVLEKPRDFDEPADSSELGLALSLRPHGVHAPRGVFGVAWRALGLSATCFAAGLLLVRAATSHSAPAVPVAAAVALPEKPATTAVLPEKAAPQLDEPAPVVAPAPPPPPLASASAAAKKKRKSSHVVGPLGVAAPSSIVAPLNAPHPLGKPRVIIDDGF